MSMSLLLGWGLMRGIKIPHQDFALKMQGGLMRKGGYFRDTTVFTCTKVYRRGRGASRMKECISHVFFILHNEQLNFRTSAHRSTLQIKDALSFKGLSPLCLPIYNVGEQWHHTCDKHSNAFWNTGLWEGLRRRLQNRYIAFMSLQPLLFPI